MDAIHWQHSIMVRSSRSRGCASTLLIGAVALLLPARTPGSVFLCAVTNGGCPQGRADVGTVLGCREYADAGGCQQVSADFFLAQARTVQPFVSLFTSPSALNQPVSCALVACVHLVSRLNIFQGAEEWVHCEIESWPCVMTFTMNDLRSSLENLTSILDDIIDTVIASYNRFVCSCDCTNSSPNNLGSWFTCTTKTRGLTYDVTRFTPFDHDTQIYFGMQRPNASVAAYALRLHRDAVCATANFVEDLAQPLSISAASLSNLAIDPAHPDACVPLSYGGTALGLATVYGATLPAVWFQLQAQCASNASCHVLPTPSPTAAPTAAPTTAQPTAVPSANPTTMSPTSVPTGVPTTAHPTHAPSPAPTAAPRYCYGQCGQFTVVNLPNGSVCYCDAFCVRYVNPISYCSLALPLPTITHWRSSPLFVTDPDMAFCPSVFKLLHRVSTC